MLGAAHVQPQLRLEPAQPVIDLGRMALDDGAVDLAVDLPPQQVSDRGRVGCLRQVGAARRLKAGWVM